MWYVYNGVGSGVYIKKGSGERYKISDNQNKNINKHELQQQTQQQQQ